jgi:hypothetical protein
MVFSSLVMGGTQDAIQLFRRDPAVLALEFVYAFALKYANLPLPLSILGPVASAMLTT